MNIQPDHRTRVIIADDHPPTRAGLRSMLEEDASFVIVGEADNGRRALELALEKSPDLMLLDIEMPEMTGVEVARQLKESGSNVRIIALSAFDYREYVYGILDGGASGYMKKQEATSENLHAAIETVLVDGEMWISPTLAIHLVRSQIREQETSETLRRLSKREMEVLVLVAQGHTNLQIAEQLFLAVITVKNHIQHSKQKLGIKTRNELVAWVWERGVVPS